MTLRLLVAINTKLHKARNDFSIREHRAHNKLRKSIFDAFTNETPHPSLGIVSGLHDAGMQVREFEGALGEMEQFQSRVRGEAYGRDIPALVTRALVSGIARKDIPFVICVTILSRDSVIHGNAANRVVDAALLDARDLIAEYGYARVIDLLALGLTLFDVRRYLENDIDRDMASSMR